MPVNTTNAVYDEGRSFWFKNRVALAGEEAVKQHARIFLPDFGMEEGAYVAYLARASYFNAPGRTHQGMVGLAFKEDPKLTVGGEEVTDTVAVTKNGEGVGIYAKRVVEEQTAVGRVGLYATFPDKSSAAAVDPYAVVYKAESVINWRASRIEGKEIPTMVVLHESYTVPDSDDAFKLVLKDQYRVLALVPPNVTAEELTSVEPDKFPVMVQLAEEMLGRVDQDTASAPVYAVLIYRPTASNKNTQPTKASDSGGKSKDNEDKWIIYSATIPVVRGKTIKEIPFVICNLNSLELNKLDEPALNDQVNVSLSNFRTSADLETGRHFTGLPQPCTAGFDVKPDTVMTIGSGVAWNAEEPAAKAWYLEFEGKGLESLEKAQETKSIQMAILGSRMLEEPKKSVESSDTHSQRKVGEESNLKAYITTAERAISRVLQWIYEWKLDTTEADSVALELNKDFSALPLDPSLMDSLQSQTLGGLMSYETYFYNLSRRGAYPEGTTVDMERDKLSEGVPGVSSADPLDLGTDEE